MQCHAVRRSTLFPEADGTGTAVSNGHDATTVRHRSDPSHHLAALAPFPPDSPPTPLSSSPSLLPLPTTTAPKARKKDHLKSKMMRPEDVSVWLRWAVSPGSALRLLLLPVLLAVPTHFILEAYLPPPQRTWTLDLACLGLEGWTWTGLSLNPSEN
ncbi:hypothetical protein C8F04DRAFT_1341687 [Mycena alexandri]|uniref:Uncharacterized protein n=1 Tax=Mycena alexandri TaxID=1745969 RepID=A0AAD6X510_9AGAR|nr:hypothetical protein C8F04DRAFT_1341687 [Mycena alexandri]